MKEVYLGAVWTFDFDLEPEAAGSTVVLRISNLDGTPVANFSAEVDVDGNARANVLPSGQSAFAPLTSYHYQMHLLSEDGIPDVLDDGHIFTKELI